MGVGAAPPARGSAHTPISAGETAGRVPGAPRPDAVPSVREPWEASTRQLSGRRLVTEDAHHYAPVRQCSLLPSVGAAGRQVAGRTVAVAPPLGPLRLRAGRRLRAPVAVASIAPCCRGGSIGGRRGKGSRGPMPGLCTGPRRYRVWGTRAGGTGIMTGGTGLCRIHQMRNWV
eukprot:COSAG01_NODE_436_length_17063_cov_42.157628_21_plen_173_part_00